MQTLEELAKNWNKFVLTSIATASILTFSIDYLSKNNITNNTPLNEITDITYSYHGRDGFRIEADFGDMGYIYTFDGECKNEQHLFAMGNTMQIIGRSSSPSKLLSLFDVNCDFFIDTLRTENGTCSASAGSSYEMCNQRTYDIANRIFQQGLKRIKFNEFSRKYYNQRFNSPELPEEQTKRLLDGFLNKTTQ